MRALEVNEVQQVSGGGWFQDVIDTVEEGIAFARGIWDGVACGYESTNPV
ncbi:MAG: hypothetical protein ACOY3E_15030 [Pseudomonadota bacterium]